MSHRDLVDLPRFPVQLIDASMYATTLERRDRLDSDPEKGAEPDPRVAVKVMASDVVGDGRGFGVLIGAWVTYPLEHEQVVDIRCSVSGLFVGDSVTKDFVEHFREREAVALLYPYLRGMVANLVAMADIDMPALPTLDVLALLSPEGAVDDSPKGRDDATDPHENVKSPRRRNSATRT